LRFFTSDNHFGHANIIDFCNRPFKSVGHMQAEMVTRWNAVVGPDDEVWHLGDFAMGRIDETLPIAGALNGRINLLVGNHDRPFGLKPNSAKAHRWISAYSEYFTLWDGPLPFVLGDPLARDEGVHVFLNHFPGRGVNDRYDRKFGEYEVEASYPGEDETWVLHGHTHSTTRLVQGRRLVHVGVDAWDYTPVAEDTIIEMIS
jgi:calcineurin-like phosphoesterase family protein